MQKFTFLLFLFTTFQLQISAQTEAPTSLRKGRLYTTEGFEIKFRNLKMDAETYQYNTGTSTIPENISTDQILRIEKEVGTEAAVWGLSMGAGGLLGAILGASQAENQLKNQGQQVDKDKKRNLIIGFTAASTLIGVIIGSTKKKHTTIYENPTYKNNSQSFHLDLIPMDKGGVFALKYRF